MPFSGELAEQTIAWNREYGAALITRTANLHSPYYLEYFFDQARESVPFALYKCNTYDMIGELKRTVDNASTPYFMHAWSNIFDLPETEAVIRRKYPFIAKRKKYFHSGITLYAKDSIYNNHHESILSVVEDFEQGIPANQSHMLDSTQSATGRYSLLVDHGDEFGPGLELKGPAIDGPIRVVVSAEVRASGLIPEAKLVFSIDRQENILWYGRELKHFITNPTGWNTVFAVVELDSLEGNEFLKAYVWNDRQGRLYIDDFKLLITSK